MIRAGDDPNLVQAQLGHSSISITYDAYGHLFPDRLDEPGADLDQLIRRVRARRESPRTLEEKHQV